MLNLSSIINRDHVSQLSEKSVFFTLENVDSTITYGKNISKSQVISEPIGKRFPTT